ncbi:MAG: hypothetical protein IAE83_17845 [Anaerolinea sp.]|nr:hypothetical protein [Anaerolinea sp.]MCC6973196.1 hypothetical protein [Anaerolineae bacterium]CAG0954708.1 hypothetical protein ANRL4_00301 [Anaerolineae bacterium]
MRKLLLASASVLVLMGMLMMFFAPSASPALAQGQTGSNWLAFYWNNTSFTGSPAFSRVDAAVNFNWSTNSPVPGIINADNFSVRWSNRIFFPAGTYRFRGGADDGIRVAINGQVIINRFSAAVGGFTITTADISLAQGDYEIIVDYYEGVGEAGVLFDWFPAAGGVLPGQTAFPTATFAPIFTATPIPPMKAVVIVDRANIRSGPSMYHPVIAEAFKDDKFIIAAKNGVYGMETWFLINLPSGGQGWIYRRVIYPYNSDPAYIPISNVIIDAPAINPTGDTAAPVQTFEARGVAKTNVMVRTAPSTRRGDKVGVINKGEAFVITKLSTTRAWVYVVYPNLEGWVYLPNVTVTVGNLGQLPRGD